MGHQSLVRGGGGGGGRGLDPSVPSTFSNPEVGEKKGWGLGGRGWGGGEVAVIAPSPRLQKEGAFRLKCFSGEGEERWSDTDTHLYDPVIAADGAPLHRLWALHDIT